jgi:hypothetical protein
MKLFCVSVYDFFSDVGKMGEMSNTIFCFREKLRTNLFSLYLFAFDFFISTMDLKVSF